VGTFRDAAPRIALAGGAFGWLLVAGVRDLWHRDRELLFLSLTLLLVPLLVATLVSFVFPIVAERYVVAALPFFALVLAHGILALRGLIRWLPLGVAMLFVVHSLQVYYFDSSYGHHDWRAAVAHVESHAVEGDVLLLHPGFIEVCYRFYEEDTREARILMTPDDVRKLEGGRSYWFVSSHPRQSHDAILAALELRFERRAEDSTHLARGMGIEVFHYAPRAEGG
jgi:hypothetical protein